MRNGCVQSVPLPLTSPPCRREAKPQPSSQEALQRPKPGPYLPVSKILKGFFSLGATLLSCPFLCIRPKGLTPLAELALLLLAVPLLLTLQKLLLLDALGERSHQLLAAPLEAWPFYQEPPFCGLIYFLYVSVSDLMTPDISL